MLGRGFHGYSGIIRHPWKSVMKNTESATGLKCRKSAWQKHLTKYIRAVDGNG